MPDAQAQPIVCPYPAPRPPAQIPLAVLPEHPCPYLPGRQAQSRGFLAARLPGGLYHSLMDANFRRSGELFYQPICRKCRACMQIRVPADLYKPSRSQRRCWRANQDLKVDIQPNQASDEKFELYQRYLSERHHSTVPEDRAGYETFLAGSPVESVDISYRDRQGRLIAVGVCDVCSRSISSVYFYFDPGESRRGLGTFGAMWEIALARRLYIPWYYIGYWVKGCRSMEYKAAFRPCQVLGPDGTWHATDEEH